MDISNLDNIPKKETDIRSEQDRINYALLSKLEELSEKLEKIQKEKIIDETQLSEDLLEEYGMLPKKPRRLKRGRGFRPILKSEIEEAKQHTVNEAAAAKWLGISIYTYKKYAKLYGIWNPQPNIKGKRNLFDPNRGKYPLNEILQNKHPNVEPWVIKDKLVRSGYKKLKCDLCGFCEKRIGDNKVPLLLNFEDGNNKNHSLENLKFYCFNCTFVSGRGYIKRNKFNLDPDWIEGARADELRKGPRY